VLAQDQVLFIHTEKIRKEREYTETAVGLGVINLVLIKKKAAIHFI